MPTSGARARGANKVPTTKDPNRHASRGRAHTNIDQTPRPVPTVVPPTVASGPAVPLPPKRLTILGEARAVPAGGQAYNPNFMEFTQLTANMVAGWDYKPRTGMLASGPLVGLAVIITAHGRTHKVYLVGGRNTLLDKAAELQASLAKGNLGNWKTFGQQWPLEHPDGGDRRICWNYVRHYLWSFDKTAAEQAWYQLDRALGDN